MKKLNKALNPLIVDQIIYGMENQKAPLVYHISSGKVVSRNDSDGDSDSFLDLPEWTPADGFRLMESFAGSLNNPLYREKLLAILQAGSGVFRKFKDAVKERQEIEQLWFTFKERNMRNRVKEWYEQYFDAVILEGAGPEPELTENLILSDFSFHRSDAMDQELLDLDYRGFMESSRDLPEAYRELLYQRFQFSALDEELLILKAIDPMGTVAGVLRAGYMNCGVTSLFELRLLYVQKEFRGLGIGKELFSRFIDIFQESGASRFFWTIPEKAAFLSSLAEQFGGVQNSVFWEFSST